MTFVGIWIEKGMGLVVPGFIPSTLHEMVEYVPSLTEWKITLGIVAGGLIIYTLLLKIALPLLSGWTPGLSVGVEAMDAQHRQLFDRLNALVVAIRSGCGATELDRTMDFLDSYVREHFADEEKLLADAGYPGLEGHRRMHAGFTAELESVRAGLASPQADRQDLAERLHLSMRDWLLRHIQVEDRAYGVFLKQRLC
jgi:hemerythrin-like metal-binding protein